MNVSPLIPLVFLSVACINTGIGWYVLRHDIHNKTYRAFFIFSFGASLWTGGFGLLLLTHHLFFVSLLNIGGLLSILGLFRLSQIFPHVGSRSRVHRAWYLPFFVSAFVCIYPGLLIETVVFTTNGITPTQGILFPYYAVEMSLYALVSLIFLSQTYLRATPSDKTRFQYFFLGLGIFVSTAIICDVILPALGIFSLNFVGPVASILSISATAYAIVRHELLDIKVVVQRGLIYTFILLLIVGFYIIMINIIGSIFGENSGTKLFSSTITTMVGVFTVPKIERYFRQITDTIFFQDKYDYAEALQRLSECLDASTEVENVITRCEKNLACILKARYVSVLETSAEPVPAQVIIPLTLDGVVLANIFLGEKCSGDPYTAEDRQLLETFAHQVATALSRAHLYRQVRESAQELEKQVQERTSDLRATQENQRQMMADISHDLQTPLTVFQMRLEQLKKILPQDAAIHTFERSLLGLSGFIDDLLTLANPENETLAIVAPVHMSALVEDIVEETRVLAESQGIGISSSLVANAYISGDSKEIRKAIMNLVSNSIKYMRDEGPKEILFSLSNNGDALIFSIKDTGIGISPEHVPFVFERFYRAKEIMGEKSGTGLGLSISKKIIEQHGGTLRVESVLGKGTVTTLTFPSADHT